MKPGWRKAIPQLRMESLFQGNCELEEAEAEAGEMAHVLARGLCLADRYAFYTRSD